MSHDLPLAELRDALDLDDDDVPYDVEVYDDHLSVEVANTEQRPSKAKICGFRENGLTLKVVYLPEDNEVVFSHAGPSVNYRVSLDKFREKLRFSRVLSENQFQRAQLYANREWDRRTCVECGRLITDKEREKVEHVVRDHPEEVTGPLCDMHQKALYSLWEYTPWEPEYTPGGDNEVEA